MPSSVAAEQTVKTPARRIARVAGGLYLAIIMASLYSLCRPKARLAFYSSIGALAVFVIVVSLLFFLLRPASRRLSFVAALFGLAGATMGIINRFHLVPFQISNLVLMAFWCILVGILILWSSFMPRFVGVLMVIAAPGYLTLLWPPLGNSLNPWNLIPGGVGELTLAAWLLVKGVDQQRWTEQSKRASDQ